MNAAFKKVRGVIGDDPTLDEDLTRLSLLEEKIE
jgi:hypothetical protein